MRRYPAPVLRRPARAHRHRARARGEARVPGLRRIGRGARRLDPGAGAQPVHGAAQSALNLTYLFISHDLGVVAAHQPTAWSSCISAASSRARPTAELFAQPNHPYTQALLRGSRARSSRSKRTFVPIKGEIPSPLDPPPGCHFHPRCPHAMPVCRETAPPLVEIAPRHLSACHLNDRQPPTGQTT